MKKLLVLAAVVAMSALCASTVSAQGWSVGARVGSGLQAVGQRNFADGNYLEMRLGMDWIDVHGVGADVSLTYNWAVTTMDLTDEGIWFVDLGAGLNVGGSSSSAMGYTTHYTWVGLQGVAKFGYTFEEIPLSLAFDWSPVFGIGVASWDAYGSYHGNKDVPRGHHSEFRGSGVGNFGISCVYSF